MINGDAESRSHWAYALGTTATAVVGTKGAGALTKTGVATTKTAVQKSVTTVQGTMNTMQSSRLAQILPYGPHRQVEMPGGVPVSVINGPVLKENLIMQAERLPGPGGGLGKVPSKSNYRSLYLDKNPGLPKGWQVHHSLPQKYDGIMRDSGINIRTVKYLRGVDPKVHQKITNEWTRWDKSLGRAPTGQEIRSFEKQIDQKYNKYWH